MTVRATIWGFAFMAACTAIGCGGPAVKQGDGLIVVEDGDNKIVAADAGGTVALPKEWPSDVPVYEGAKIDLAQKGAGFVSLVLRLKDPIAAAAEFYGKTLPENGWKIENSTQAADVVVVSATKEKRICSISAASDETGSTITLSITESM